MIGIEQQLTNGHQGHTIHHTQAFSPTDEWIVYDTRRREDDIAGANPYGFTRRTGVCVDLVAPHQPIYMDARHIAHPYTAGALRGGTHAHSWSGDGQWISFTYNDYVLEQLSKTDSSVKDLRVIGVMAPFGKVSVLESDSGENHSGDFFSVIVTQVTETPEPDSDQIDRAFDECWTGRDGYQRLDGT